MRNRADVSLFFFSLLPRGVVTKAPTKRLHFVARLYSTTTPLCIMRWAGPVLGGVEGTGLWRHSQIMGFFPVSFLPGEEVKIKREKKNGSNWWCNVLSNRNRSESEGPFIFYSLPSINC